MLRTMFANKDIVRALCRYRDEDCKSMRGLYLSDDDCKTIEFCNSLGVSSIQMERSQSLVLLGLFQEFIPIRDFFLCLASSSSD